MVCVWGRGGGVGEEKCCAAPSLMLDEDQVSKPSQQPSTPYNQTESVVEIDGGGEEGAGERVGQAWEGA